MRSPAKGVTVSEDSRGTFKPRVEAEVGDRDGILPSTVSLGDIHLEVDRICAHLLFAKARSLQDILRFTVAETLAGRGEYLKEYSVALTALHRSQDFDPRNASIVRTQARNLRRRLREYYAVTGYESRVYIVYKLGCYAPSFHATNPEEPQFASRTILAPADEVSIAMKPLAVPQEEPWLRAMSEYFENCLCCNLVSVPGVRVMATDHAVPSPARPGPDSGLRRCHYRLEGAIFEGASIHLSLHLVNANDGWACWAATSSASRHDLEARVPRIAALMAKGIVNELERVILSAQQRLQAITSEPTQSVRCGGPQATVAE